jgi:hypothetical protein
MPKIRLRQAVVFDGETYPPGHVFDTDASPISAECLIQREWGDEVSDDSQSPAVPAAISEPVAPKAERDDVLAVEPTAPQVPSPVPAIEPPKKPRKK